MTAPTAAGPPRENSAPPLPCITNSVLIWWLASTDSWAVEPASVASFTAVRDPLKVTVAVPVNASTPCSPALITGESVGEADAEDEGDPAVPEA